MDRTAIDAFPDPDNDGAFEMTAGEVDGADNPFGGDNEELYQPCQEGADLDGDLDPSGLRTDNADTAGPAPLINLDDVKPGDFGEVTFSAHLCDNDGYLWLCGDLVEAAENGNPEPEENQSSDSGPADETTSDPTPGDEVELLDEVQTALWYDDSGDAGNNLVDERSDQLDVMLAVDVSGSIESDEQTRLIEAGNDLAEALANQADVFSSSVDGDPANVHVGLLLFGDDAVSIPGSLGPADPFFDTPGDPTTANLGNFISSGDFGGNTPMAGALEASRQHLNQAGRSGADKTIVLVTDGGPNYEENATYDVDVDDDTTAETIGTFTQGSSSPGGTVQQGEMQETADTAVSVRNSGIPILTVGILTQSEASGAESNLQTNPDPTVNGTTYTNLNNYLEVEIAGGMGNFFNTEFGAGGVSDIASELAQQVTTGDEVFFTGSLRDALIALEDCIPLDGDRSTEFDELTDPENDADRDPYISETTHYIGFSWWVPTSVGNQIQSDRVTFDLGFHAQQARNNDGTKQT